MDEAEETRRGQTIADILCLRRTSELDRYHTEWGPKTALGIYRMVKRLVEEGEGE